MLKKLIKRIKQSIINLPNVVENRDRQINQTNLQILLSQIKLNRFIPYTTWSISPTALLHILNFIKINRPKYIVEFGSGISTIYIAKLIKYENLDVRLVSIDHDEQWAQIINNDLLNEDIPLEMAQSFCVPLKNNGYSFLGKSILWYDSDILNEIIGENKVEFIIVDGPIGAIKYSRAGSLIYFKDKIENEELTYLFDDTNRDDEKRIVDKLGKNNSSFLDYTIGGKQHSFDPFPLGLLK